MLSGEPAYGTDDDVATLRSMALNPKLPHPRGLRDFDHLRSISRRLEDPVEIGRRKEPGKRWSIHEFIQQARGISETHAYEQPPEAPKSLTQLPMEKKVYDWRSEQVETRIRCLKMEEGVREASRLMHERNYDGAGAKLQELSRELLPLPRRFDKLKRDLLRRLTILAYLQCRAGPYPDIPRSLDVARPLLAGLPAETHAAENRGSRSVERRFGPHRADVMASNVIQANFVADERSALAALGDRPARKKLRELQARIEKGKAMFAPLEPARVGVAAYERTRRALDELTRMLAERLSAEGG
jgi:hypothetical protein